MVSYVNKPPYNSVITVFYFIYHVLISSFSDLYEQ